MQDDTSTMISDCMRSSPWLSCYMSQVPSFLFSKIVFKQLMHEINLILTHIQIHHVQQQLIASGEQRERPHWKSRKRSQLPSLCLHTFTFESLFDQPPEQAAAVVAEGRAHVVVNFEAVRHVNVETFLLELWAGRGVSHFTQNRTSFLQKIAWILQSYNNLILNTPALTYCM